MLYLLVIYMFCRFTAKVILTPPAVDKLELSMLLRATAWAGWRMAVFSQ